jgi:predicted AAA+ superfamily ATPase
MTEVWVNDRAKHTTTLESQFDVIHSYIEHALLSAIHDHFERRLSAIDLMRGERKSGRSGSTASAFSEMLKGELSGNA